MPTLFRFLVFVGLIFALAYGAMIALVTLVQPELREIVVTIPADKLGK
ncbi:histidine kinase [Chelatococcus reniformis]|uniref:Histidine kinase n=1 Tax=Chelatococcus reniformis TaxID=1494448 RepID=A0A916UM90_9HYPH|nr:histidine kinase [Chelatococcus reniformis]GGC78868.1 hypothetical protein GCM10010994_41260 [Chelatococcus reniformis]